MKELLLEEPSLFIDFIAFIVTLKQLCMSVIRVRVRVSVRMSVIEVFLTKAKWMAEIDHLHSTETNIQQI